MVTVPHEYVTSPGPLRPVAILPPALADAGNVSADRPRFNLCKSRHECPTRAHCAEEGVREMDYFPGTKLIWTKRAYHMLRTWQKNIQYYYWFFTRILM
jgi:hypothetical protein